jgi:hypothetical protein
MRPGLGAVGGVLRTIGEIDYPAEGEVELNVVYAGGTMTGTYLGQNVITGTVEGDPEISGTVSGISISGEVGS